MGTSILAVSKWPVPDNTTDERLQIDTGTGIFTRADGAPLWLESDRCYT